MQKPLKITTFVGKLYVKANPNCITKQFERWSEELYKQREIAREDNAIVKNIEIHSWQILKLGTKDVLLVMHT